VNEWGSTGSTSTRNRGSGTIAPNEGFVAVVKALSKYFGPASDKGLIMSFASYQLSNDKTVLQPCASLLNYVILMGYFWSFDTMTSQFNQYAAMVGSQNLMFGIGAIHGKPPYRRPWHWPRGNPAREPKAV
jgi:hypothetical protein